MKKAGMGNLVGLALLAVCGLLPAGAEEGVQAPASKAAHPYQKLTVGQWVEYRMVREEEGKKSELKLKQTVKAIDETSVTLTIESEVGGERRHTEQVVRFEDPRPQDELAKQPGYKELGKGEEALAVAGKEYASRWVEIEVSIKNEAAETAFRSKTWTCGEVPFDGVVKLESRGAGFRTEMVLLGFGK